VHAFVIFSFSFSNMFRALAPYNLLTLAWLHGAQVRQLILCYTTCVYDRVRTSCVVLHDILALSLHCVLSPFHPNSPTHVR
jgi:hypothetical protein